MENEGQAATLLGERYQLGDQVGKGRVGTVHVATDTKSGAKVAVKLISPLFVPSSRSFDYLSTQLERRLPVEHPNILRLLDIGKAEGTALTPSLYLVIEYVDAPTLADRIAMLHTSPFSLRQVLRILKDIADAVLLLHSKGIIVSDLNPKRIFLCGEDCVKLPAFSYTSSVQWIKDPAHHTAATAVDYRYAAPEMFDAGTIRLGEAASDMYLYGILAFQLACGIVPYEANRETLIQLHLHEPVPDTLKRSNVPTWYEELVASCMAKDPDSRISFAEISVLLEDKLKSTEAEVLDASPLYVQPNGIRVLFVEDNKLDQLSFARFAKNQRCPFTYKIARSVENAEQLLESREVDVVVSDFMLPDGTGVDVIRAAGKIPTIVLTGAGREDVAALALRAGAFDYLSKDMRCQHLAVLPQTVQRAFEWGNSQKARNALSDRICLLEDRLNASESRNETIHQKLQAALALIEKARDNEKDREKQTAALEALAGHLKECAEISSERIHRVKAEDDAEHNEQSAGESADAKAVEEVG
ncbi:MAG: response regulator [Bdellovibrionota bacterium]